jgi:hypothetical protein
MSANSLRTKLARLPRERKVAIAFMLGRIGKELREAKPIPSGKRPVHPGTR